MLKTIFDRVVALIGFVILSPIMLLLSILIGLQEPRGAIFYTQQRVGQYGVLFNLVKFRTMKYNASGSSITTHNDPRITNLGSWLRKFKLDELPTLWNVLIGEMSFVGPRPDVPGYADLLEGEDQIILNLKPGLTGPATLKYIHEEKLLSQQEDPKKFNDEVIYPDKVKINLDYYHTRSFFGDIGILIKTVLTIFIG